ncbi:hypothetical protein GCM10023219_23710 [Stakelama sediminis]|uniref:Flp pilus assembly protein TadG n=1 Tax=Stakelama sediminis TaxID=463200 RepID=A0A840YZN2_9SPHN|nr:TadE/TadG family type IV pilus assembly protein [Stakelama sediminis]MBB5718952.1 Flp pilus assembly protein TadG [Stakelama sediminis]
MIRSLRTLKRDKRGVTLVEFAFVAPVLCLLLMGAFDFGYQLYTDAILQGIVQKTARDSSLENGGSSAVQAQLDNEVIKQVHDIAPDSTVTISRRYYKDFSSAAAADPEPFTDTNGDGTCDDGEPYEDDNLNGVWDKDGGNSGQGGAKDSTVYTVTVQLPRVFPLWKFIGGDPVATLVARTILRNQPYGDQTFYGTPVQRNCT